MCTKLQEWNFVIKEQSIFQCNRLHWRFTWENFIPVRTKRIKNGFISYATGGYGCCTKTSQIKPGKQYLWLSLASHISLCPTFAPFGGSRDSFAFHFQHFSLQTAKIYWPGYLWISMRLAVASLLLQRGGVYMVWKVGKCTQHGDSPE